MKFQALGSSCSLIQATPSCRLRLRSASMSYTCISACQSACSMQLRERDADGTLRGEQDSNIVAPAQLTYICNCCGMLLSISLLLSPLFITQLPFIAGSPVVLHRRGKKLRLLQGSNG